MLDPSTCPVPLPAVDRDGQPWPSYTVASEALEDCSLEPEYWSRRHGSCSDGKRFLSKSTGFSFASYYFREETLVGFSSGGDVVVVICGACTADGQGDVGCEVVEESESFCPASALQCEVGASRCDGARREVCHDSFAGYELVETCTSPEACNDQATGLPSPRPSPGGRGRHPSGAEENQSALDRSTLREVNSILLLRSTSRPSRSRQSHPGGAATHAGRFGTWRCALARRGPVRGRDRRRGIERC